MNKLRKYDIKFYKLYKIESKIRLIDHLMSFGNNCNFYNIVIIIKPGFGVEDEREINIIGMAANWFSYILWLLNYTNQGNSQYKEETTTD